MIICAAVRGVPAESPASNSRPHLSKGPPSGEADFPIGVWLQDPRNASRYRAAGVNLYIGLWRGPTEAQLAELARARMPVICAQNRVGLEHKDDSIIVGWMHDDEPDNAQSLGPGKGYGPPILPEVIVRDYRRMRDRDSDRPVLLNLGQGVAWDDYIGRGVRRNHPEDYAAYVQGCDLVSFDIYPVVHDSPQIAGHLEYVARGVERLVEWAGPGRTVWNCIECTHIGNPLVKATPAQVRAEVWMALVKGSRGLIYFVHQFQPKFREAALLDDPEMLAAVTAINRQIHELAPVLNSPDSPAGGKVATSAEGARIAMIVKQRAGVTCVFAVNFGTRSARGTFSLPWLLGTLNATVLDENRDVSVRDGKFEDDFGPYAVHLYRVPQTQ